MSILEDIFASSVPSDEVKIPHVDGNHVTRKYVYQPMGGEQLAEWRRRFSGVGRTQGNSVDANLYVFSECFLRIESPVEAEQASLASPTLKKDLLDLAAKDGRYAVLLDGITNQFVNRTLPSTAPESAFDPKG